MGTCTSRSDSPELSYSVDPQNDLGMTLYSLSDSEAYNRKGSPQHNGISLTGVQGITYNDDYLPSLKKRRRGPQDDDSCRLTKFSLASQGLRPEVAGKLLLSTKAPRLSNQVGPPTLDILFRDRSRVRVGYQPMPPNEKSSIDRDAKDSQGWMATSIHFDDETFARYRIQMKRVDFPFLVQLFETRSNSTCASLLTFGPERKSPRTMHMFSGNVDNLKKAGDLFLSQLFGVLDENDGTLAFQEGLSNDLEKASLCVMILMRTRMLTFNGDW